MTEENSVKCDPCESCESCDCEEKSEDGFCNISFDMSSETMLFICQAVMKKANLEEASISVFNTGIKNLESKLIESKENGIVLDDQLKSYLSIEEMTYLLGKSFFNQFTLDALKDTIARGEFLGNNPSPNEFVSSQEVKDDNI